MEKTMFREIWKSILKKGGYLEKVNINVKYDVNMEYTDSISFSRGTCLTGTSQVEVFITY